MPGGKGRYGCHFEGQNKPHLRIETSFDGGATWMLFMEATSTRKT